MSRFQTWRFGASFDRLDQLKTIRKVAHCTTCKHPGLSPVKIGFTILIFETNVNCYLFRKVNFNLTFGIGSSKEHRTQGCEMCGSQKYCEPQSYEYECRCPWHKAQEKLSLQTAELAVRKKALEVPDFPNRKEWIFQFTKYKLKPSF